LIPIINGVVNDVQVYASNVNGYRLYNALISIDVTWDGVNAVDYLSSYNFLNWIWHLQQKSGTAWNEVKPSSMSITAGQDSNGCYVTRQGVLSDGSTFTIKYSLPNNGALKFSLSYTPAKTAAYRLWFEVNGIVDGNTNAYVNYAKPNSKRVHFDLPSYVGLTFDFDYSDVSASLSMNEQFDTANYKYNWYVELGNLKAGTLYTVDPTTVSTTAGQYATALGNSRKLFRDAYGKYIAVFKNVNVMLAYCNNDPPTSGWNVYDLGSTYAVDAGEQFGVAAAYDSTNDRLMICWVSSGSPKFAQVTFTRDANHNITGYTVGSVLTITPAYSPAHCPSLWMLHNGEVAAVWGADKTSGAKHSVVEFCRVVFGSPPTYKNAAGTANSKNTISNDYTTYFVIRYPCVVQRTNSGTGQYDLYAVFGVNMAAATKMNKATWTGSAWTWGTETSPSPSIQGCCSINYDVTNGLIVHVQLEITSSGSAVYVGTISADDTVSNISLSGLSDVYRYSPSLVIVGGDYYVFYMMNNDIYYVKRSGGSWSSETQFTTTANENYPSCKIDGSANRIELIWTHYTGSAYNVYYDYLSLAVGVAYTKTLTESLGFADSIVKASSVVKRELLGLKDVYGRTWAAHRTYTELLGLSDVVAKNVSVVKRESLGLSDVYARVRAVQRVYSELLGLKDATAKSVSAFRAERLGLMDFYSRSWTAHRAFAEPLGLSDTVSSVKLYVKTLTELLGLSDVVAKVPSVIRAESLGLLDSYSRLWSVHRTYSEHLGLADKVQKSPSILKSDLLGLLDSYSRTWTAYRAFAETLGLSDTISKSTSVPLTEHLALLDTIAKSPLTTRTEVLGLKDHVTKEASSVKSESLGLVDTVGKEASRTFVEALGLSDAFTRTWSIQRAYVETLGLVDTVSAFKPVISLTLSELLGLYDTVSKTAVIPLIEPLGLVDAVTKSPSTVKAELLGLKDFTVKDVSMTRSERLGLKDVAVKSPATIKSERLGLFDAYSRVLTTYRVYSERLGLADRVQKSASTVKLEKLGLSDIYSRIRTTYRTYTELLGLSDKISKTVGALKAEALGLKDTFSRTWSAQRILSETLGLKDTTIKTAALLKSERLALTDTYSRVWGVYRTYTETLGLKDTVFFPKTHLITLTEVLGLYDRAVYAPNVTVLAKLIRKYMQLVNLGGD